MIGARSGGASAQFRQLHFAWSGMTQPRWRCTLPSGVQPDEHGLLQPLIPYVLIEAIKVTNSRKSMDPFSIATATVSLAIAIGQVTSSISQFVKQMKEATNDFDLVLQELGSLSNILD